MGVGAARSRTILAAIAVVVLVIGGLSPRDADGSGDAGCGLRLSIDRREVDRCNNVPFLSPANDSAVNLVLLLADRGLVAYGLEGPTWWRSDYVVPFALDTLRLSDGSGSAGRERDALRGADARENPDPYADGEANRCRTNSDAAVRAFVAQVTASSAIPDAERAELERSRRALVGSCSWNDSQRKAAPPANVQSPLGREFATYLDGVLGFYAGAFDDARRAFESLRSSKQAWLQETAQYMVGRTELNRAQQDAFDPGGYPSLDRVDRPALEAALAAFEGYLHDHPAGLYAASAKGLLRRVYWLMNDRRRLAREYAWLLANANSPLRNVSWSDLVFEIDRKLVGYDAEGVEPPTFVAVMDLMAMRAPDSALHARLEAQRPLFADERHLYDYLSSALAFYVDEDAKRTLASLPAELPDGLLDAVAFSQQTLRGLALEKLGEWNAARALWRAVLPHATHPLQRAQVELAFARNCERSGHLDEVFAHDSPIADRALRRVLLRHVAAPALLRRQIATSEVAGERDAALSALLYKELMNGRYREFLADLARLPKDVQPPEPDPYSHWGGVPAGVFAWRGTDASGYHCPSIRDVATVLAKNPQSPVGRICLAEFLFRNELEEHPLGWQPDPEDLGGTPSPFPVKVVYSRLDAYLRVIADPKARRDDRAYALYRAVNCFAASGYNHCGGQRISLDQRRQWFRTLKTRYADTTWGRELKYYW